MSQRQAIFDYAAHRYGVTPEYLWQKFPSYAVLRHHQAKGKWFALIGHIERAKLGLEGGGSTDFLNVKCTPEMVGVMRQEPNVLPAYHMNKTHWMTIVLDNGFPFDDLIRFLDWSYDLTAT